jgi:hypothetical protein
MVPALPRAMFLPCHLGSIKANPAAPARIGPQHVQLDAMAPPYYRSAVSQNGPADFQGESDRDKINSPGARCA